MSKDVILLHGLYLNGLSMVYIGKYLEKKGFSVYYFEYNTVNYEEKIVLEKLHSLINMIKTKKPKSNISLLGFSMGGLVARNYVQKHNDSLIHKILTIGTPHNGSTLAKYIQNTKLGFMLGQSGNAGIVHDLLPYDKTIPIGCIAGTKSLGLNNIFQFLHKKSTINDGLVFLDEAILPNAIDSITINNTHKGMLFSKEVNELSVTFLNTSKF